MWLGRETAKSKLDTCDSCRDDVRLIIHGAWSLELGACWEQAKAGEAWQGIEVGIVENVRLGLPGLLSDLIARYVLMHFRWVSFLPIALPHIYTCRIEMGFVLGKTRVSGCSFPRFRRQAGRMGDRRQGRVVLLLLLLLVGCLHLTCTCRHADVQLTTYTHSARPSKQ